MNNNNTSYTYIYIYTHTHTCITCVLGSMTSHITSDTIGAFTPRMLRIMLTYSVLHFALNVIALRLSDELPVHRASNMLQYNLD